MLGRGVASALLAGAALAVEIAPTLALATPASCAPLEAIVVHASCLASAYGDAQRIGGRPLERDTACASAGIL
jgi:hypothetical protein